MNDGSTVARRITTVADGRFCFIQSMPFREPTQAELDGLSLPVRPLDPPERAVHAAEPGTVSPSDAPALCIADDMAGGSDGLPSPKGKE